MPFGYFYVVKYYRYLQAFSIDVAAGSCTMSYLVAKVMNIDMPLVVYFSLFMSVWLVYTLDHLLDSKEIKKEALTLRHRLHQKNFKLLAWVWLALFVVTCSLSILYLPPITLKIGLLASVLVVSHLFMVYLIGERLSLIVQKELGVAITYTVGVLFGPLSLSQGLPEYAWWVIGQIFIYAFINLLEFSYFDLQVDSQQGQVSIARIVGKETLSRLILVLVTLGLVIQAYCFYFYQPYLIFQLILTGIYLTLVVIFMMKNKFSKNDFYRLLGDFVFLYPALLFIV